jgi:hypothetical protein
LASLAQAHLTRFELAASPDDLRAALTVADAAVKAAPRTHSRSALLRSNRARTALMLAEAGLPTAVPDLDVLVDELEAAARNGATHACLRPVLQANLAAGHRIRHTLTGQAGDVTGGTRAYQQACADPDVSPEIALGAASEWAQWASARRSWAEACDAFGIALRAASRLWRHQVDRETKESWLRAAVGLPGDAVVAAGRAERLRTAVEFAEQTRAQLLTEALGSAGLDLTRLADDRPGLAARYRAAAARAAALGVRGRHAGDAGPPPPALTGPASR